MVDVLETATTFAKILFIAGFKVGLIPTTSTEAKARGGKLLF